MSALDMPATPSADELADGLALWAWFGDRMTEESEALAWFQRVLDAGRTAPGKGMAAISAARAYRAAEEDMGWGDVDDRIKARRRLLAARRALVQHCNELIKEVTP